MPRLDPVYHRICKNCGLTYGSHKFQALICPANEGSRNWHLGAGTLWEDSGKTASIKIGTSAKNVH